MSDFFNSDEEEFRDIPDEVTEGEHAPAVSFPQAPRPAAPVVEVVGQEPEEIFENEGPFTDEEQQYLEENGLSNEQVEEEEEDYTNVLDDARLRLEQGRLYEMVMKHDMFGGLDADPKAVKVVQAQIIKFAKEQMEIMLGMRQVKQAPVFQEGAVSSPFNDLEVKLIKEFCSKMSNGKSAEPGANQIAQRLNAIGGHKPPQQMAPVRQQQPQRRPAAPARQVLPSSPARPVTRNKPSGNKNTDYLLREGMSEKDLNYKPLKKNPSQMTTDELLKRNEEAKIRQEKARTARPANATPLPSYEQEEAFHAARSQGSATGTVGFIMNLINTQQKNKKQ
jgi:hypothetical protein